MNLEQHPPSPDARLISARRARRIEPAEFRFNKTDHGLATLPTARQHVEAKSVRYSDVGVLPVSSRCSRARVQAT